MSLIERLEKATAEVERLRADLAGMTMINATNVIVVTNAGDVPVWVDGKLKVHHMSYPFWQSRLHLADDDCPVMDADEYPGWREAMSKVAYA